jgi:hypothetical protein
MSKTFSFLAVCLAVLLLSVQVSKQNIRVMPRKNTWNFVSVEISNISERVLFLEGTQISVCCTAGKSS